LNNFPFKISSVSKSKNIDVPDFVEVKFTASGVVEVKEEYPLLNYEPSNCMLTIGLKEEENCMTVYIDNDGKPDFFKMSAEGEPLKSEI
jgi:hypothetical protein